MKKKILAVVLAVVILAVAAVGATLAWLMDTSAQVKNTFTIGNVKIEIAETGATLQDGVYVNDNYKLIPGTTYMKDPKVTVQANSEACWLFVTVTEEKGTMGVECLEYAVDLYDEENNPDGWKTYTVDKAIVAYYREVEASNVAQPFYVLKGADKDDVNSQSCANGMITIKDTLTQANIDTLTNAGGSAVYPSLTFQAYAIQKQNVDTVADAWAAFNPPAEPESTEAETETPEEP